MTESVHSRIDPVKRIGRRKIAAHEEVCTESEDERKKETEKSAFSPEPHTYKP